MIQKLLRGIAVVAVAGVMLLGPATLPAHASACLDAGCNTSASGNLYTTWDNHQGVVTSIYANTVIVGGCSCDYAYENIYYGPVSNNVVINQHSAAIGGLSSVTWYDPHDSLAYDCGSYHAAITVYSSSWNVIYSGVKNFCY